MPRLKLLPSAQVVFDELDDFTGGARMIMAPDLARFMGRDVRCVREWIQENDLTAYPVGRCSAYMLRDVAKAIADARTAS